MHVQIIGAEHSALAGVLAQTGVCVSLVVSDPDDRARLQDMSSRSGLSRTLGILSDIAPGADLVLGTCDDAPDAVSLDWSSPGPSIRISSLPDTPLLLEQNGADPTSGQIQRLVHVLGAAIVHLPAGQIPISARLSAAIGLMLEHLMLAGAAPAEIDAALVGAGWTLGPAEVQDIVGVDTALSLRQSVHGHLGIADDLPLFRRAVAEGRLGRKVGVGWYRYPGNGGKVEDPLVEDMAAEEARFAGIEQSFPDASDIVERIDTALRQARHAMPETPDEVIDKVLHHALGLLRDRQ